MRWAFLSTPKISMAENTAGTTAPTSTPKNTVGLMMSKTGDELPPGGGQGVVGLGHKGPQQGDDRKAPRR